MTPHEEIASVLRQAIRGELQVSGTSHINWWEAQEPPVKIGDWVITLFTESGWIYDIYDAYSPDGRVFNFTPRDENSSINLFLSDEEVEKLCLVLGRQKL